MCEYDTSHYFAHDFCLKNDNEIISNGLGTRILEVSNDILHVSKKVPDQKLKLLEIELGYVSLWHDCVALISSRKLHVNVLAGQHERLSYY